ncbi:MAG: hypothetical protein ACW96U_09205 [Candidatus Heimdallarchaeaceae archaeon]
MQDIITFEMETVKIVTDPKAVETLYNPLYGPIIVALREGPLTVKELDERYEKYLKKIIEKKGIKDPKKIKEELAKKKRSDKSLYRYLKILEEHGLVAQAGKRVEMGKVTTETLFSRTARLFYSIKSNPCCSDNSLIEKVRDIIVLTEDIPDTSTEKLSTLLQKIDDYQIKRTKELFENYSDELEEIIADNTFDEIDSIIRFVQSIYTLMHTEEIEKELKAIL